MRPSAVDLCCGAGGASMGLWDAGFRPLGVDIKKQPNYPFEFLCLDVTKLTDIWPGHSLIWASPPCQRFSDLAKRNRNAHEWPNLIPKIRDICQKSGVPYVIENVEGAPLNNPITLCGTMFRGLRVLRHRIFECSFPVEVPPHPKHPLVHTHDKRKAHYGKTDDMIDFVQVTGGGNSSVAAARDAMGISWMTKDEINESIPPAYAEYIGRAALAHIAKCAAAA